VALAAIGLWYDDYVPGGTPVTADLVSVLSYTTGIEDNDANFGKKFPFMAQPWAGDSDCSGTIAGPAQPIVMPGTGIGVGTPDIAGSQVMMANFPNPFTAQTTVEYEVAEAGNISIQVYDMSGKVVSTLVNQAQDKGRYSVQFDASKLSSGIYFAKAKDAKGQVLEVLKMAKN
jgi:hypothetical protein